MVQEDLALVDGESMKTKLVNFRMNADEIADLKKAAAIDGVSVSEFIRSTVNHEATERVRCWELRPNKQEEDPRR